MEFGERLKRRRTINDFKQREVPRELLLDAIDVARWAPNHRLTEPWHFYLLGEQTVDAVIDLIVELKTAGKGEATRAAVMKRLDGVPAWFAVTCKRSDDPVREREDYAACCCAIQNMMLYLWQAGIGVKWTTGAVVRDERLFGILKLRPSDEFLVGLFYCGYPEVIPEQRRRPVVEIVTSLS
jgi:nitroreductase